MLLAPCGLEPSLARAMDSAAALLSPHSMRLSSSLPVLPKGTDLKEQNAQSSWRLEQSALANAASGELPFTKCLGSFTSPVFRPVGKAISCWHLTLGADDRMHT